ncbi:MAG: ethanolamine ammonia-lyase reactivating factor EutA [Acidocella sp.]|nr:ethanolamine ammonia-lyase reactivating factor EutA [Acidocella sp.]
MDNPVGGRLFFTNARRSIVDEDEIQIVSVGIDIGSSTTHLAFSRITLERVDSHYIVAQREVLFESAILLTPYVGENDIDTAALKNFFEAQYQRANIDFDTIDTGALILTGTAVWRNNARAIADIFAKAAGKFVSISAGDGMEAILAAHGAGGVALSVNAAHDVLNIDIGGGTTKLARCYKGEVREFTAIDIGARLIAIDEAGRLTRLEPAGRKIAEACGIMLTIGAVVSAADLDTMADVMTDHLMEAIKAGVVSQPVSGLLRLAPLTPSARPSFITFSGGVSEYVYQRASTDHGDLGLRLAQNIARKVKSWGPEVVPVAQGIRATVIGASQYTVQVSGSTIFVSDLDFLPLRNVPTIMLTPSLLNGDINAEAIAADITRAIATSGVIDATQAFALGYSWQGSATFVRLEAFCRGVAAGFACQIANAQPLILVGDCDIGGLIGLHFAEELHTRGKVVSIDGIISKKFDFIDIGKMLEGSGSVPVVVKSLIFPGSNAVGHSKYETTNH